MQHVDSKYKCRVYDSSTVCFFLPINFHYNNRLIICIDLFLKQPAWGFCLNLTRLEDLETKLQTVAFDVQKVFVLRFHTWWWGYSWHFQRWLLQNIHSSVIYTLNCYNTGGIKTWEHSEILGFLICASTKECSVWGSLHWCLLTVLWVQCSVA